MNAPIPLQGRSGVAIGLQLVTFRVPKSGGAATIAEYWNFADEDWDPQSEYDKAKHLKPFGRLGADGASPYFKLQVCPAPAEAFEGRNPSVLVVEIGADGQATELVEVISNLTARKLVGLND